MNLRDATDRVVDEFNLQPWWRHVPEDRDYARDIIAYLTATRPKSAAILELGCGIAQNLAALQEKGFTRLAGMEYGISLFLGALELCDATRTKAELVCGDAEKVSFYGEWDVVMPLNWTYRDGVDIPTLLMNLHHSLREGGEIIIDIIDISWPSDRSPEYAQRYGRRDVERMIDGQYSIVKTVEYCPRVVYHLEKR